MNLKTLKRQWLEDVEHRQRRSQKTLENYDRYLQRFVTFSRLETPVGITEKLINTYRAHLAKSGTDAQQQLSVRTQNYHLSALRQFLGYLRTRGFTDVSPRIVVRSKEVVASHKLLPAEMLARLLDAPNKKTFEGRRDRTVLLFLATTGMRTSELCALLVTEVDLVRGEILVAPGTKRERTVFLLDEARVAAEVYLSERTDIHPEFFLRTGRKANGGGDPRLIPRQVQRLIKKYAAKAGIATSVTPQILRNTYATQLIKEGVDLHTVRALLGHEHLSSTEKFANLKEQK